MKLSQYRELKKNSEKEIEALLYKFQEDTGVGIDDVCVHVNAFSIDRHNRNMISVLIKGDL